MKGNSSIFLSDWNKQDETYGIDRALLSNALIKSEEDADKYFFIDETHEVKTWLSNVFTDATTCKVNTCNFALSSNGTATIFLILYNLCKNKKLRVLLFSPIYFTYVKLLKELSVSIDFLQIVNEGKITLNYDELTEVINSKCINLIILNDPLFGSGLSFGKENYIKLAEICRKCHIKLLVDYMYGGMEWDYSASIINNFLLNITMDNKEIILIESMSKRIFLNGIKTSLAFAHSNLIRDFEISSVHTIGTLTSPQVSMIKQIYDPLNSQSILNTIEKNINIARENYSLLKTLVMGTGLYLSNCDSGYFCLMYIPYSIINTCIDNQLIAEHIIENVGVLTIPHDRYLHFCSSAYCFRVNLSIPTSTLQISISKLLSFCNTPKI